MSKQIHEQKIGGRVRARLTVDHDSGIATMESLDDRGAVVGTSMHGAGSAEVSEFIYQAEPKELGK